VFIAGMMKENWNLMKDRLQSSFIPFIEAIEGNGI
jgi:hypothetical protein